MQEEGAKAKSLSKTWKPCDKARGHLLPAFPIFLVPSVNCPSIFSVNLMLVIVRSLDYSRRNPSYTRLSEKMHFLERSEVSYKHQ